MLNLKYASILFTAVVLITWRTVSPEHPADKSDFWDNISDNFSNTPETDVTHDYWDPLEDGTTDATLAMNNYVVRLLDSEIIPQMIAEAPRNLCRVIYSYELGQININPGIFLFLHDVYNPPEIIWECDPDSLYAITMTDPDDLGLLCEEQLWVLGNIRDCSLITAEILYNYRLPEVGDTLGVHRFNFFVYKQPGEIDFSNLKRYIKEGRCVISCQEFSKLYNLGQPIAGNFFLMDF